MSWFGRLFGTEKAVENIIDKDNGLVAQVGNWVGNMNYTEEEKAEANERTREWGLKQLSALEPFKVIQRILAFGATFFWIFVGINFVAMMWVEHSSLEFMKEFAFSEYVWWPTSLVFGLYFGGGVIDSLRRKPS